MVAFLSLLFDSDSLSYYTKLTPVLFERGHETVLIVVEFTILE